MSLIKLTEVKKITSLGRTSIYNYMKAGNFPQSVNLGERAVAWVEDEVNEWVEERVNQRVIQLNQSVEVKSETETTEQDVIAWMQKRFKEANTGDVVNWLISFINKEV